MIVLLLLISLPAFVVGITVTFMELIATFIPSRRTLGGYRVSFLLPDARTSVGRVLEVADRVELVRVLEKLSCSDLNELRRTLAGWGQGSAHVLPSEEQVRWLNESF